MSHKDKKNKTSVKEGEKLAEKYSIELATELMEDLMEEVERTLPLSLQAAVLKSKVMTYSTFYYLLDKFPKLVKYKKRIFANVIYVINEGALKGELNATAGIWRMKQSGETDKQEIEQTNINLEVPIIQFVDEDTEEV